MRAFALVCLSLAAAPAGAVTQGTLVDPRPKSAIVDLTHTLQAGDIETIDGLANRARAGGELMVVVIDSVSRAVPRTFTTELFNRFGLDGGGRNRGVMLLVALKDRKAEIVVGDGYPNSVISVTDRIMADVVVERFKAGRPRDAIVEAARAIVDRVIVPQPAAAPSRTAPAPAAPARIQRPAGPQESLFAALGVLVSANPMPVGVGLGLGGLAGGGALLRRHLRKRPRRCKACGTMMMRLAEIADDAYLTSGEKVEERVGSVDYDVWSCRCGQTMKLRYGTLFTSYGKCSACEAKTLEVATTTLVSATTSSEGRARVDERCAHCGYSHSYERSIPRERESTSSSDRGSSSGRGSSGSW